MRIHLENPSKSWCATHLAKLSLLAFLFIFLCVAKDAVAVGTPVITSATTASGTVGSAFSYQITATNTPSSYKATGLPAGLTVNSVTGLISGTPTAAGNSTVTLSAVNSHGTGKATLTLTIKVAAPVITSATTANGTTGSAFSYQITATNTPSSYGATGLPAGLTVNSGTGLISGTPTAAGTSTVTLSASNSGGTGNATLTLTITPNSFFVQAVANISSGTASSVSLSFSNNTLAGDLIMVGFDFNASATPSSVTDSQGNTFTQVGTQLITPGGARIQVYYAKSIKGGADTVTINLSASVTYIEAYLTEYTGVNETNPLDAQAGASGSAATVSSGNATTTVAGDLIYGYCVGDGSCTAGTGFTARSTFDVNLIEDATAGNPGSYAATGTATSGWAMQMVALEPASSGTGSAPVASLSPASLTFASQAVGATSAAQSITLNNTGNAALTLTSIALTGTNPGDFAQTNTCGSSVAAGANCTISVTFKPTASGTRTAAVTLTDNAAGSPQTVSLSGTGVAAAPAITSATTASGTVGSAFSYQITATNTPSSYGATGLPAGLTVNSGTGLISGTPTVAGTSSVTLSATDSGGTGNATLTLTISLAPPVITSATTANGTTGSAFSYQITATNTPSSYGATGLPAGLTMNSGTGLISGTPTAAGTSTVTLSATNSGGTGNATLTLTVSLAPPVITSATTASGTVGSAFSYQIAATNTPSSYGATGLPAGLTVNSGMGLISGTPTAAGTSTVTLSATNSGGTGNATLALTVNLAPPAITSATTANGTTGSAFSYQITATNSPSSYGATGLPVGLTVNSGTGLISGAPTAAGTSTVTLSATNSGGTGNATLTLTVNLAPPVITSATTANGTTGSAFSYQITATNTPSSYGATGLPAGLTVNSGTGLISGTPTVAGTSSVTLSATDSGGTGNATLTLTISLAPPVITSATTANGTTGSAFSYQITATNTPSSYGATGLPAGLTMNSGTGLISGTPTAAGTSTVTLSASNSGGTGNATLTLTITPNSFFVQAVANISSGTASSVSLSFSNNTLAGDLIMVGFDFNASATPSSVTDSQGNTFTQVGTQLITPGGARIQVYYAKSIKGGADTVTINLSANVTYIEAYLTEYTGVNETNPLDAQAGASGSAATVSSGNATTTVAGDLIYGYCVGDGSCTAGTGFTARSTFDVNLIEDATAGNPGSYAATGTATSGWAMQMVALLPASSGTGSAPVASLSPASLTFASQAVGATSAAQSITLNNTGNAALTLTSIALTGTNPGDFAQTNTCGSSVAAGANCTISVTFKPTASGTRTAAVTLTDNATGSPQSVNLTGTGSGPIDGLSPTSLTFTSQAVGATSAAQSITLSNTGNAALTLTSIALTGMNPGDYAQTNTCGSSVAAGTHCTISVTFKPTASGTRSAAVTLTDNAAGSPQTVSLSGTGESTSSVANVSPSNLTFGNEPAETISSPQTVTLNNTGSVALSISSIAFTGADPADFIENNTCGSSVAAGGTCTIAISFTPSASGARTASLTIADNATGSPQSVALSGTGTHDVILTWTASSTSGIVGYNVYRGTTSGGENSTPLNSSPISGNTYTDENVTAGTEYYYVVMAVASNDVTQSSDSNEASATVPSP